jgi:hypothetical protein
MGYAYCQSSTTAAAAAACLAGAAEAGLVVKTFSAPYFFFQAARAQAGCSRTLVSVVKLHGLVQQVPG